MPPSKRKAANAAMKNRRHEVALHVRQATVEEQIQQQIDHLSEQSKRHMEYAITLGRVKIQVQDKFKETQQNQAVALPTGFKQKKTLTPQLMELQSQIPASQAPSLPPTTLFQSSTTQVSATNQLLVPSSVSAWMPRAYGHPAVDKTELTALERRARRPELFVPTFDGDYEFDFGTWKGAYLSKLSLGYIKTLAGQNQVLENRPGFLKALFEQKPQILFEINQPFYLRYQRQQEQTGLMSSSSIIASSSSPPIFSSSPSRQFDLASSPLSYPTEVPMLGRLQETNACDEKLYMPRIASPRSVLTKAGPSTPAGNTRARVKTKVLRKDKGKAPYIKQEPLDPVSAGVKKRGPGRPRKIRVQVPEKTELLGKRQLTLFDCQVNMFNAVENEEDWAEGDSAYEDSDDTDGEEIDVIDLTTSPVRLNKGKGKAI